MKNSFAFQHLPETILDQLGVTTVAVPRILGDTSFSEQQEEEALSPSPPFTVNTPIPDKSDPYLALEQEAIEREEQLLVYDELRRVLVTTKVLVLTAEDLMRSKSKKEHSPNNNQEGIAEELSRSPSNANKELKDEKLPGKDSHQNSSAVGNQENHAATIAARIRGMDHMVGLYLEHRHQVSSVPLVPGLERQSSAPSSSSSHAPSTSMTSPNSWIDTSLHLDGWCIRHASVIAKVGRNPRSSPKARTSNQSLAKQASKGGGVPHLHVSRSMSSNNGQHNFTTHLAEPSKPYVLQQVLSAHSDLSCVVRMIDKQLRLLETKAWTSDPIAHFIPLLEEVCKRLEHTRNIMLKPNRMAFPQAYSVAQSSELFAPHLEEDIVLEFHVQNDELIVDLITIQSVTNPPEKPSLKGDTWFRDNRSYIGKKFIMDRKYVEVIDHAQVRFTIHTFQQVLAVTQDAIEVMTNTLQKFKSFAVLNEPKAQLAPSYPVLQAVDP